MQIRAKLNQAAQPTPSFLAVSVHEMTVHVHCAGSEKASAHHVVTRGAPDQSTDQGCWFCLPFPLLNMQIGRPNTCSQYT